MHRAATVSFPPLLLALVLSACTTPQTPTKRDKGGAGSANSDGSPSGGQGSLDDTAGTGFGPIDDEVVDDDGAAGDSALDDTGSADGPTPDNPIGACEIAVANGEDPRIDDFADGDMRSLLVENRDSFWFTFDDTTPGGTIYQDTTVEAGPDGDDESMLHVTASGWADFGSGFGVVMRWQDGADYCQYDASYYDGITFWARGTGTPARVGFTSPDVIPVEEGGNCEPRESCYDNHGIELVLTEDWRQYKFKFESLVQEGWGVAAGPLKSTELFALLFQLRSSADYEIWVDDVAFYKASANLEDAGTGDSGIGMLADASSEGDASSDAGSDNVPDELVPDGRTDASIPDAADASTNADGGQ